MKVDCDIYSKSMELLSLKVKLEKGISNPEELREIRKRIDALERELNLD
jgi:ribosomal protein L29